jgi:hypothetical protein
VYFVERLRIIRQLAELPPDTVLSEEALARMFGRHPVSIKRAVSRGELPPSIRLFGKATWTARAVLGHLNNRLEAARKETEQLARRISHNSA